MSTSAVTPERAPTLSPHSHDGPTADPAWVDACVDVFGLVDRSVEVEGAWAPLSLDGGRLELIGTSRIFEPMDLQWRDDRALEELVDAVALTRRPLRLFRLPASSPALPVLRDRLPLAIERDASACPVLHLDDEPERLLSSRRRQDLRRARRRAEGYGTPAAEVCEPSAGEADALIDRAFAIESRSWKARAGTALAVDRPLGAFYRTYARAAAAAGTLRLAFLTLGGTDAAMQVAVERGDALWLLKIGYDERFASCSPGQLLMAHTLTWSAERGLDRYEFLGTASTWTRWWTREEWACRTLHAYPPTPRGGLSAAVDGARRLRRLVRR